MNPGHRLRDQGSRYISWELTAEVRSTGPIPQDRWRWIPSRLPHCAVPYQPAHHQDSCLFIPKGYSFSCSLMASSDTSFIREQLCFALYWGGKEISRWQMNDETVLRGHWFDWHQTETLKTNSLTSSFQQSTTPSSVKPYVWKLRRNKFSAHSISIIQTHYTITKIAIC